MKYDNPIKNRLKLMRKRPVHRLKIFVKYCSDRREKEPIFIIATRRTGSNLLLSYLNSIPGVSMIPEVLNASMFYGIRDRYISKRAVFRHIAHSINHCEQKICGTKLLAVQLETHRLSFENLKKYFPKAKFIILYRKSILEQFVSLKIAQSTNVWEWKNGASIASPIEVSIPELIRYSRYIKVFYGNLFCMEWLKDCAISISYEDLKENAQQVFDRTIFSFLRLPQSIISTRMVKQNSKPLSEVVSNFNEVKKTVFGPLVEQEYSFDKPLFLSIGSPHSFKTA